MRQDTDMEIVGNISKLSVGMTQSWFVICDRITQQVNHLNEKMKSLTPTPKIEAAPANSILANLPVAVLVLNNMGVITYHNQQTHALFGEVLVGLPWSEVVSEKFKADTDQLGRTRLENGRIIHISTQSIKETPGQMITLTDITKDSELEEQLERMQRLSSMGQMAASLAHQIRTPLTAALLYANHLDADEIAEEKRHKFASKTVSRLKHIEVQVQEMLAFVKGTSTQFDTITLDYILDAIEQGAEAAVEQSRSRLSVHRALHNIKLKANPDALVSAMQNCIMNAIEACSGEANIDIICELAENNYLNVIVADQSGGIPKNLQQQVIEPFFTTRSQGTGLGLAVAKVVCEAHGGSLWLKSLPDVGTQVGFYLPILTN